MSSVVQTRTYPVPLIPQDSTNSCWSAAAKMINAAAGAVASCTVDVFRSNANGLYDKAAMASCGFATGPEGEGLEADEANVRRYAAANGLVYLGGQPWLENPMSIWQNLISQGPLLAIGVLPAFTHAFVIAGMSFRGNAEEITLYLRDPLPVGRGSTRVASFTRTGSQLWNDDGTTRLFPWSIWFLMAKRR